jgi:hypothetical protein
VRASQVPHSYSSDGTVRFGDNIQLRITHKDAADRDSHSFLANNIWNRVDFEKNTISVTATGTADPVARNVFVLSRPYVRSGKATGSVFGRTTTARFTKPAGGAGAGAGAGGEDGGVLRYGDRFYLATNPSLRVDSRTGMVASPYLLYSELASTTAGSGKGDAKQDVVMSLKPGPAAEWKVVAADGSELATEGTPVIAGTPVMIVHVLTNQALAGFAGEVQA